MPRFFLHVCTGTEFVEDEEGLERADRRAAREEAVEGLRDILAGFVRAGLLHSGSYIEIEDEHHHLVETVTFSEAVQTSDAVFRPPRSSGSASSQR